MRIAKAVSSQESWKWWKINEEQLYIQIRPQASVNLPDRNIATWIVYSAIYVCGFVVLLTLAAVGLKDWDSKNVIPMLADVTNGAIGIGLFAALTWEVIRFSMVIFYPILKRRLMEEGRREGRQEGRQEERDLWEAWNKRREEALANNQSFDEPPPSRREEIQPPEPKGPAGAHFVALTWEVIRFSMVIFYPILKRRLVEQGRQEERELWEAWNKRREEALANNQSFDEPPPSRREENSTS